MSRSWLVAYQLTSCVYGRGFAEGREESGICDSGRAVLTHGGCGRKVNSLHKQLNYSFIINPMYIQTLCTYYLFAACICGSLAVQRDWNAPSISLLLRWAPFITSFSPSTAKERGQKPQWLNRADRQENDLPPTSDRHIWLLSEEIGRLFCNTFFLKWSYWESKAMLQRGLSPWFTPFIPSPTSAGKCCPQANLFYRGRQIIIVPPSSLNPKQLFTNTVAK